MNLHWLPLLQLGIENRAPESSTAASEADIDYGLWFPWSRTSQEIPLFERDGDTKKPWVEACALP